MSPYAKLGRWPKRRPNALTFRSDRSGQYVYICDFQGTRLLIVPMFVLRDIADGHKPLIKEKRRGLMRFGR